MNANSRPELDELLGAYALDAIEPVERYEMEQYLHSNGDAQREVDELRETAALLALLHGEREPAPANVWEGIQSAIDAPNDMSSGAAVFRLGDRRADRGSRDGASRRRMGVPLPLAALLVAAASVAIVLLVARHNSNGRSVASAYHSAVTHGGHEVAIVGKGVTLAHVVEVKDGTGYFRADRMPALPAGKVYQLWVAAPGRPGMISLGVLGGHPRPYSSFVYSGPAKAFAVSIEPAPGSVVPTDAIGLGTA